MKLEFLPEARSEFLETVEYYEEKQIGLGKRFRAEIAEVCSTILEHPHLWRERHGGFRRVNCPVFPYYIYRLFHSRKYRSGCGSRPCKQASGLLEGTAKVDLHEHDPEKHKTDG